MTEKQQELKQMLINNVYFVDVLAFSMPSELLQPMLQEAEEVRRNLIDDYQILTSQEVKEIALEHYNNINKNIRTIKFLLKYCDKVVPVLERVEILN